MLCWKKALPSLPRCRKERELRIVIKGIAVLVPLPSVRRHTSPQNAKGEPPALRAGVPGYKAFCEDRRLFFRSCIFAKTGGLTI